MTTYHRYTSKDTPMSDWGHAMLAEDQDNVRHYGPHHYTYDGSGAVDIRDLEQSVRAAWAACQVDGFDAISDCSTIDDYYQGLTADEVVDALNPADIVNSAGGWDCDLAVWAWWYVLEPAGVWAVTTQDGAIVFDQGMLALVTE